MTSAWESARRFGTPPASEQLKRTRLAMQPEFAIYAPDEGVELERLRMGDPIPRSYLGRHFAHIGEELDEGLVRARLDGLGRGAEAAAIVFFIAASAYAAVKTLNELAEFGRNCRALWVKLREATPGPGPALSLGAIQALCAADLRKRVGDLRDVEIRWSGDVGGGLSIDLNHTGEDLFMVLFTQFTRGTTWMYLVDAPGRLLLFEQFREHPETYMRYTGAASDGPLDLHYLLDD